MHDSGVIGIPTPLIEQAIQPRPCPRPMYRMLVPIPNEADVVTGPGDSSGAQSQIGGAPVVFEMRGDAGTVIEGANGAENEFHYLSPLSPIALLLLCCFAWPGCSQWWFGFHHHSPHCHHPPPHCSIVVPSPPSHCRSLLCFPFIVASS